MASDSIVVEHVVGKVNGYLVHIKVLHFDVLYMFPNCGLLSIFGATESIRLL